MAVKKLPSPESIYIYSATQSYKEQFKQRKQKLFGFHPMIGVSSHDNERQKKMRCWYCGSDPGRQSHPHKCDLSKKIVSACSFRNHPDVKNNDHSKPWKKTPNGEAYCALNKYIVLNKKLNSEKKDLVDNIFYKKVCQNSIPNKKNIENPYL